MNFNYIFGFLYLVFIYKIINMKTLQFNNSSILILSNNYHIPNLESTCSDNYYMPKLESTCSDNYHMKI